MARSPPAAATHRALLLDYRTVLVFASLFCSGLIAVAAGACQPTLSAAASFDSGLGRGGSVVCRGARSSLLAAADEGRVGVVAVCRQSTASIFQASLFEANVSAAGVQFRLLGTTPTGDNLTSVAFFVDELGGQHIAGTAPGMANISFYVYDNYSFKKSASFGVPFDDNSGREGDALWRDTGHLFALHSASQPWLASRVWALNTVALRSFSWNATGYVAGQVDPQLVGAYAAPAVSGGFVVCEEDTCRVFDESGNAGSPVQMSENVTGVSSFGGSDSASAPMVSYIVTASKTQVVVSCPTVDPPIINEVWPEPFKFVAGLLDGEDFESLVIAFDPASNNVTLMSPLLRVKLASLDLTSLLIAPLDIVSLVSLSPSSASRLRAALVLVNGTLVVVDASWVGCTLDQLPCSAPPPAAHSTDLDSTSTSLTLSETTSASFTSSTTTSTSVTLYNTTSTSSTTSSSPTMSSSAPSESGSSSIESDSQVGIALGISAAVLCVLFAGSAVVIYAFRRRGIGRHHAVEMVPEEKLTPTLASAHDAASTSPHATVPSSETFFADASGSSVIAGSIFVAGSSFVEGSSTPLVGVERGSKIASGNFGSVYLGKWNSATVAIKVLHQGAHEGSAALKEFANEVMVLAALSHPNLVRYFGFYHDVDSSSLAMVMEYLAGGSLSTILQDRSLRNEHFTVHALVRMSRQIAAGLAFLASRAVVHRDLACRNCLASSADEHCDVKIADFGMARIVPSSFSDSYYTAVQKTMPIRWSAPETIAFARSSTKSDVWSLGVTFWEIFESGSLPFPDLSNVEIAEGMKAGNVALSRPTRCPKDLWSHVLLPCLSRDPQDRPSSAEVVVLLSDKRASWRQSDVFGSLNADDTQSDYQCP